MATEIASPARSATRVGASLILVSAVSFGIMPVLAKLAYAEGLNTNTVLALRFTLAAVGMWAIWATLFARGERTAVSWQILLPIIAMGALGYVGQSYSYFTAVSLIPASFTGLLLYTYPILVTILAWLIFREPLTGRKLAALAVGLFGTLLVLGLGTQLLGNGLSSTSLNSQGVAWGLAAALIYSAYIIAGTRFTANVHPVFSSAIIISSAALVYLVWGVASNKLTMTITPLGWLWAFIIAGVSTVLAISTFFAGLKLVGPSRAAILSTVEPAVTVALAASILGEPLTPEQLAGGALILSAVVLLQART